MNRRKFFTFLPSAGIASAGTVAAALAAPVKAEDIEGLTVESGGTLVIQNCQFTSSESQPALLVKQS